MKNLYILIYISFIFAQEADTTKTDTIEIDTIETDTTSADTTLFPEVIIEKEKSEKLPEGEPFFDFKDGLEGLQIQIDSLKRVIRVLERKSSIPPINKELLNLIKMPELQHRIELTNGTVVMGEIIEETDLKVIIKTSIGQLYIDKDKVVNIEEESPPAPKVELMSEPFVSVYPDHEEITGVVKNAGKIRADFVRIIAKLWTPETELVTIDSAFAAGSEQEYKTGVITDTAIEPGATASFTLTVPLAEGLPAVEYRTYDIRWIQAE